MRKTLRATAVLALPALINAVALSDMTPRATDLPPACENLYTAQIAGCSASDFTSQQCSTSCINSLDALVSPIQKACGGQGVTGQNLVVAFLAGVGPQQLCHNANSATTGTTQTAPTTTAQKPTTTPTPSIISSTTTAQKPTDTKSLIVDTSSSMSQSTTTSSTSTQKNTSKHTPIPVGASSSSQTTSHMTAAGTSHTSATKTTSAAGNSQTNYNDGSGGGSPFDTPGNLMNAAAGRSISVLSLFLPAVAAVMVATLR